jgi:hypothetical protein
MTLKRLAKAMPWVVGIGLCVVEAMKLGVMFDSTTRQIAGTGHTEAFQFASAVSTNWSYITEPQMWALGGALTVVLLLAGFMVGLNVWNRMVESREAEEEDLADRADLPAPRPYGPRSNASVRGPFGRVR